MRAEGEDPVMQGKGEGATKAVGYFWAQSTISFVFVKSGFPVKKKKEVHFSVSE